MSQKPILIAGAGICSLLLARALRRASIPFIIFERDAAVDIRAQGFRLRLSSDGLDSIEAVLGPDDFAQFWNACRKTGGGGFTTLHAVTAQDIGDGLPPSPVPGRAVPKFEWESRGGKIVSISRGEMRRQFLKGCEPHIVCAHQVTGYELTADGVRVVFADGSKSVEGEMLIAGDGIHSRVAKQLSAGEIKVYDTGVRTIHGRTPLTGFRALGEGFWRLVDTMGPDGSAFAILHALPSLSDDSETYLEWSLVAKMNAITPPKSDSVIIGQAAAEIARRMTNKWHPKFRPLFENMDETETSFWKITISSPDGVPVWKNEPRVTLMGDAVHSMTPAGGNGANNSVKDAALLGRLLAKVGGYEEGITAAYEKEMRVYASDAVRVSYGMAKSQFSILIDENSVLV